MIAKIKKQSLSNNALLIYFIAILSVMIGTQNASFFSVGTLITLSRAMLVTMLFALGEMVVIIAGGIDVSFPAIANFSLYAIMKFYLSTGIDNLVILLVISILIGFVFGIVNSYLIAYKNVPPLIATLGLSSVIHGATLAFLGTAEYSVVPESFNKLASMNLFSYANSSGITFSLSILVLIPIILLVVVNYVLKNTKFGRSLYVVGGGKEAAQVSGFNVKKIISASYVFSAVVASIGGLIYMILMRNANPQVLMGSEMIVIAAVVMGGARITGGHGTVFGTFLGILLITIIQNNLVMLGVPAHYQTFVIGVVIIIGASATSIREKIKERIKVGGKNAKN